VEPALADKFGGAPVAAGDDPTRGGDSAPPSAEQKLLRQVEAGRAPHRTHPVRAGAPQRAPTGAGDSDWP
jgi:hypothetical protein